MRNQKKKLEQFACALGLEATYQMWLKNNQDTKAITNFAKLIWKSNQRKEFEIYEHAPKSKVRARLHILQ